MILPSKNLKAENSLIYIGGRILGLLDEPKTVSRVWEEFQKQRVETLNIDCCDVAFDWFVISLDMLYVLGALDFQNGRLLRRHDS